jgi:hypothetical protein
MVERLHARLRPAPQDPSTRGAAELTPAPGSQAFRGRTWITRPRPGIDRMASAWLIRTHVDRRARFVFGESPRERDAVPFDMYEGEFSHSGEDCTFEVLARRFGVRGEPVAWLARVVHDVDLREERYREPEAAGVAALVEGLRARHRDDHELLEAGIELFAVLVRGRETPGSTPGRRAAVVRAVSSRGGKGQGARPASGGPGARGRRR